MTNDKGQMTNLETRLRFLQEVAIFQEIEHNDFLPELAKNLEEVVFPVNHTIFTKGDEGQLLYILVSGKVKVHLDDFTLAYLEPGSYFGEMALFESRTRSASATAVEDSKCLILTGQQVYQAIKQSPDIAINIIQLLARRIRKFNRLFGASEELFYLKLKKPA
ncbi:Crp/Fnr family transcriptional regulator [[Phormidium] sp. LEGE 05292]|uniref:Crp/Fnr family transcriptional regulator n=1 Tax=[Phormidium] sp. LEGE 05292 TaxID=767427 RepID=UPI001D14A238|nr:cyclic nucleotide-binding domain-containing protein [Phormidium sp. LEGE 05292]